MMKERFELIHSMNYREMVPLFVRAGLEIEPDSTELEGLLICFEMYDKEAKKRVGGASLVCALDEYVLRTVAVEKEYRGRNLGKRLVQEAVEEVKRRGGKRLMLTAKVPEFYQKLGFEIMDRSHAPKISDCLSCPQFHHGCDSEIMQMEW